MALGGIPPLTEVGPSSLISISGEYQKWGHYQGQFHKVFSLRLSGYNPRGSDGALSCRLPV